MTPGRVVFTARSLLCLLLFWGACVPVQAADRPMPEVVVRQMAKAMEQVEEDPLAAVEDLRTLWQRRSWPGEVQAYIVLQMAGLMISEGQAEQAKTDILQVLAGQEADFAPQLRLMLGQTYLILDDHDNGLRVLEAWLGEQAEPNPNGLFLLGYGYIRAEQFDTAIERLEQAMGLLEEVPRNHWYELLGYAYARADRPQDAQRMIEVLISREPAKERWWRQLASLFLIMEQTPRGTASLAIAEHLKPESLPTSRRLARFLAHAGAPLDGAELLAGALQRSDEPLELEDQLLLAQMWVLAREFDAAVVALQAAEDIDEGSGRAALILGSDVPALGAV